MAIPDPAGAVLIAAAAGLAAQFLRLFRRWSIGRSVPIAWAVGMKRLAHAYFHTVHEVVARDPYAARMHVMTAGGLVAALVMSAILHVGGLGGTTAGNVLALGVLLAVIVALAGTVMVAWRRRPPRPARLTGRKFDLQPAALAGTLVFLLLAASRTIRAGNDAGWFDAGWGVVALVGVASLGTLVRWVVSGPMRHASAGVIHLIAHSRPRRFDGVIDSALEPLDLTALGSLDGVVPVFGAATPASFSWNRLAQFDACVQCGRCQEACPAHAAGQPLNPKQLVQDLVRATTAAGRDGAHPAWLVSEAGREGAIAPETLWACTTCRACVYECPMLIEHVDAIVDMRRYATLERGEVPAKAAAALAEMRATDTVAGRALDTRLDWAADLGLPILADRGSADVLLWLGEAAFERRNQRSLRALVQLLRQAGIDFAVLGAEELDCGDLARRLGDEATFQDLAHRNIATLARYRFSMILTADPHAMHMLRNEYPAMGGQYRVMHHALFLDGLLATGKLSVAAPTGGKVTYHDPCYLGRYNGEIAPPRRLLQRLGLDLVEMELSGMRSRCCGGGGGASLADIPARRRIPDMRMDQVRLTGAPTVAVACPTCAQMLEGVVGPRPAVTDLAELMLERVAAADAPAVAEFGL